jgi:hypothetical protein
MAFNLCPLFGALARAFLAWGGGFVAPARAL